MGRKERRDADYFPFFVKEGKTLTVLRMKYGLEGIGFFTQLMRTLSRTPDHYIDIRDEEDIFVLCADIGMDDVDKIKSMLKTLCNTKKIDPDLYEVGIIFCDDLLESLEFLYKKRSQTPVSRESLLRKYSPDFEENIISDAENTDQIAFPTRKNQKDDDEGGFPSRLCPKEKKRKEKESKEKKIIKEKPVDPGFEPESREFKISEYLFNNILEINPSHKKPNLQEWAKHVDLMIRVDKRSPDVIQSIIEWVHHNDFWKTKILSTKKLRIQFDKLLVQSSVESKPKCEQFEPDMEMAF